MADADELERALLARWDRDTLAVYADALQAKGDPRGEVIALDLELERGSTPELATRRRQRLYEWLGGSTICGRAWHERSIRFGFVTDFLVTHDRNAGCGEYVRALRASPAGPFVRGLTIHTGDEASAREAFAAIVATPWPWLERLAIYNVERRISGMSDRLVRAVIAATPRLSRLAVDGVLVFDAFPHPAVRELVADASQLAILASLPNVARLDVRRDEEDDDDGDLARWIGPAVRHVDLSRNEPTYPSRQPPDVDIYPLAASLPLAQLASLRLPSLRIEAQAERVRAMLAHPGLAIAIARTYEPYAGVLAGLTHPRLALPVPRVWPPRDELSSREALTITLPTEEYGDDLSLTALIENLEEQFDDFVPPVQAAWREFWGFLAGLAWDDADGMPITLPYPAASLLTATEALDDWISYSGQPGAWAQLAEKLRAAELPPGAVVQIRRYWGW